MVTKDQARTENNFHYGTCTKTVGSRGDVKLKIEQWRCNGAMREWKREPERFQLPIKYGMRDYYYLTNENAGEFHLASECPLNEHISNAGIADIAMSWLNQGYAIVLSGVYDDPLLRQGYMHQYEVDFGYKVD